MLCVICGNILGVSFCAVRSNEGTFQYMYSATQPEGILRFSRWLELLYFNLEKADEIRKRHKLLALAI